MTTLTGCSQIHFGKDAVTIGNVKKEKSTKAKIKKAQSSSKKTAPKKKKVVKKKATKKKVKIPKKKIVSKWDIKKTQKLQKAVNQWGKAIGQSYRFYDGKRTLKTKNGPTYPDVLKKNRFLLNKKIIKIGYSLLGKNDYQYNVVAIANENFKSWHNTYLFCLMKDKPVILLDQSKNTNPVMVKVVKGKKLNKDFSKIYTEK
ncbi:DUF4767 domain-containing protein [Lactobacillus helveticus]|uniref:DUF4767 domain-containing protein n=2 Tax=Lactobacillus helveticus TaxID=1587 RepID=A0AAV4E4X3_LACHE|nr:DUF4767 domain-containing protein [Lactobacillus helveticus]AUJ27548.1 DUF4767 domain-containing protein [Lactobacillus helveticus]AZA21843.1 MAG: DUF4767 domain-containing protein [Lactobacillus helveticus]EEW68586.1 hypothetical protein HMPREF0518_0461 [Lactobacillus helveticus DSM 20075 = CGMCC 1.1877]KGL04094.1 hypothetical protein NB98_04300 [Lactobacillus helveticus]KGL05777.1 hypothetical protein MZ90_04295 [Lactobacillus helveticus]